MKTTKNILLIVLSVAVISCNPDNIDREPVQNWFPETPKNLAGLNTEYNDYNSNIEIDGKGFDLYYSSTKKSEGGDYDIVGARIEVFENPESGDVEFEVFPDETFWESTLFTVINSDNDELGPFSFDWIKDKKDTHGNWLFLYANDSTGNFDISFININITEWVQGGSHHKIYGPVRAKVLNSGLNDYYPTINSNRTQFYFCSDRNNNFDIFKIDISKSDLALWLEQGNDVATICSVSSDYDDKCPYIDGNLMVFASNRKGGFGGFDLWYSVFKDSVWSEPVNFGSDINTEYDEYRPAIEYFEESTNDLMIFSSNRPGGKGGYDLYYTGISKMIKNN